MEKPEVKRDTKPERRSTRKRFGVPSDKSEVHNKHADYHYVWLNDVGNTINEAVAGGYEHVLKTDPERVVSGDVTSNTAGGDIGSRVCQVVDRNGTVAFLMRIPNELWEEDQELRDEDSRRPLEDLDREDGRPSDLDDKFYVKRYNAKQTVGRTKQRD